MKWKSTVIGAILSLALAAPMEAAVTGSLNLTSGAEQVTVGLTYIDWHPQDVPPGSGTGTFTVAGGTTITYTGGDGVLSPGVTGTIVDLDGGETFPVPGVPGFMTFPTDPALSFNLNALGPGSVNTNCAALLVNQSCSPFVGSPFILTRTQDIFGNEITTVTLAASGNATDASTDISLWFGSFTTQIPGMTPGQIQAVFGCTTGDTAAMCDNPNASITDAYSGSFIARFVPVPEPTMLALFGIGLIGAGARARRRRG